MATIDIAMESTSQQILNKLNTSSGGGYSSGIKEFTSNGTFTVPENVGIIYVTACGAGGGGGAGGGSPNNSGILYASGGGGGGAGQCIYNYPLAVTSGSQISITIGAGGKAGTPNSANGTGATAGSAGGSTVIGNFITLLGGQGGMGGTSNDYSANFSAAGTGLYADGGQGGGYVNNNNAGSQTLTAVKGQDSGMQFPPVLAKQGNPIQYVVYLGGAAGKYAHGGGGGGASIFGTGGAGGDGGVYGTTSVTNYQTPGVGQNGGIGAGGGGGGGIDGNYTKGGIGGAGGNGKVVITW